MSQYTIHVRSDNAAFTPHQERYEGVFESYEAAEKIAQTLAGYARTFAIYQVWEGTPDHAVQVAGPEIRGTFKPR